MTANSLEKQNVPGKDSLRSKIPSYQHSASSFGRMFYFFSPEISQPNSTRAGASPIPAIAAESWAPGLPGAPIPSCPGQQHPLLGIWLRSSSLPAYGLVAQIRVLLSQLSSYRTDLLWLSGQGGRRVTFQFQLIHKITSLLLPACRWSPSPNLPLWKGPRTTSGRGPCAWQIKDALEPVSVIPFLLDSESSLSVGGGGGREKKKM